MQEPQQVDSMANRKLRGEGTSQGAHNYSEPVGLVSECNTTIPVRMFADTACLFCLEEQYDY